MTTSLRRTLRQQTAKACGLSDSSVSPLFHPPYLDLFLHKDTGFQAVGIPSMVGDHIDVRISASTLDNLDSLRAGLGMPKDGLLLKGDFARG
jgi:hypothetical protein